ncbi:MAG: hypothetical protein A2X61_07280 [Ignavibacteria bacterium GWB2_35_12]|nr:MAG: hypothetical protein A2X63_08515 [Ignavibacteria bacterium GWA2_35_8]OGU39280.1 MAG: hypothetical protein A2X61_07280 [Ignavibacteria bacterium GWB2_35_12]OGU89476.1 MAG: hypothetical protein A2220_11025 [Ignavibacteria bacterium RIFOXYA2_FULL_35_10]OGV21162.1 MAG: hypothetical protein A2475_01380 [Ignavibacteria bacterium RIFOXYC2_FULL_35_21]
MNTALQYIINEKGSKAAVIVPFSKWEKLNNDYEKLQNKLAVITGIKDSIVEIKTSKKNGKKLQTLSGFLNESNC